MPQKAALCPNQGREREEERGERKCVEKKKTEGDKGERKEGEAEIHRDKKEQIYKVMQRGDMKRKDRENIDLGGRRELLKKGKGFSK